MDEVAAETALPPADAVTLLRGLATCQRCLSRLAESKLAAKALVRFDSACSFLNPSADISGISPIESCRRFV